MPTAERRSRAAVLAVASMPVLLLGFPLMCRLAVRDGDPFLPHTAGLVGYALGAVIGLVGVGWQARRFVAQLAHRGPAPPATATLPGPVRRRIRLGRDVSPDYLDRVPAWVDQQLVATGTLPGFIVLMCGMQIMIAAMNDPGFAGLGVAVLLQGGVWLVVGAVLCRYRGQLRRAARRYPDRVSGPSPQCIVDP